MKPCMLAERRTSRPETTNRMEQHFTETLLLAREQANRQVVDPLARALIIRYLEDAYYRSMIAGGLLAGGLPPLPPLTEREYPRG